MFLLAARCTVKTPGFSASMLEVVGCISCTTGTNVPNIARIADY